MSASSASSSASSAVASSTAATSTSGGAATATAAAATTTERVKLLFISGSTRTASANSGVIRAAQKLISADVAEVIVPSIRLPMYDGDVEGKGQPAEVKTLWDQFHSADGVYISTPEYNGYISGALKNALDWMSRPVHGPSPLAGLPVAASAASAGGGREAVEGLKKFVTRVFIKGVWVDIADPVHLQTYYVSPLPFNPDTGDLIDPTVPPRIKATLDALVAAARTYKAKKLADAAAAAAAAKPATAASA